MKYWGWIYVKDVLANPYDDILLGYIDEMCKTFSDTSHKFDDKLDKVGNISIGEDNSDLLMINSTKNIPVEPRQSLVKMF